MESRFQEHVLALRRGAKLEMPLVDLVASVLRSKLRKRGLWRLPPEYLDYADLDSWQDRADLEIVALDAIEWAVIKRLRALCARIEIGDNVDGFILLNIDHFLSERQKRADPIGHATYERVTKVIDERRNRGETVRDGHLLAAAAASDFRILATAELDELVARHPRWTPLMRALGRGGAEAAGELHALIDEILATGDVGFDPGDLVDVLRVHARRWHDAIRMNDGEASDDSARRMLRVLESQQLVSRLEAAIAASGGQQRRRDDLHRVFYELQGALDRGDDVNQSELAARLGMKKTTLSDHFRRLRELVQEIDPSEVDGRTS